MNKQLLLFLILAFTLLNASSAMWAQTPKYEGPSSFSDAVVVVQVGTTHDAFMNENYPNTKVLLCENVTDIAAMVEAGKADYGITDLSIIIEFTNQNNRLAIADSALYYVPIGVAFNKKNKELTQQFNAYLAEIKQNGMYDEMTDRWINQNNPTLPNLDMPKDGKKLRAGVYSGAFPFAYVSNRDLIGFDVEMLIRFAQKYGYQISFQDMNFAGLIGALSSGKVDIISSCIGITEEHSKQVDFSVPYLNEGVAVVALKEENSVKTSSFVMPTITASNPEVGNTIGDTLNAIIGKNKIVAVEGSIQELLLSQTLPADQILMPREYPDLFLMLSTGDAPYALCNIGVATDYMRNNPTAEIVLPSMLPTHNTFGINQNNTKLLDELNTFIAQLEQAGELENIYNYWFENFENGKQEKLEYDSNKETLKVGSGCVSAPFTFISNGENKGVEIDILTRFCKATNRNLEVIEIPFGSLIAAALTNRVDVIASTLSATPERKKILNFTNPYSPNHSVLLRINDSVENIEHKGWFENIKEAFINNLIIEKRYLLILDGLKETIILSFLSIIVGTLIGCLICYMSMCNTQWIRLVGKVYVAHYARRSSTCDTDDKLLCDFRSKPSISHVGSSHFVWDELWCLRQRDVSQCHHKHRQRTKRSGHRYGVH